MAQPAHHRNQRPGILISGDPKLGLRAAAARIEPTRRTSHAILFFRTISKSRPNAPAKSSDCARETLDVAIEARRGNTSGLVNPELRPDEPSPIVVASINAILIWESSSPRRRAALRPVNPAPMIAQSTTSSFANAGCAVRGDNKAFHPQRSVYVGNDA